MQLLPPSQALGKADYSGKVHTHSPALVTVLKAKTKKWTEKNANVLKGCFNGVLACAKQSSEASGFDKGAAKEMVGIGAEKLADKKMAPVIREMLTALAESISPGFVATDLIRGVKEVSANGRQGGEYQERQGGECQGRQGGECQARR